MSFFTIDKPPGVPYVVLKLLHLMGISVEERVRYGHVLVIFLVFLVVIAVPKMCFGYPDFESTVIGFAELFFQTNRFVGVLLIALYNETLTKLIRKAEGFTRDVLTEAPPVAQHLISHDKQINRVLKAYLIAILVPANFYSNAPIAMTLWNYYGATGNESTIQFNLLMEENFYGLDIRTNLSHYLIFGAIMVPTAYLCSFVGTAKLVSLLTLIKYCTIYFQVVSLKIRDTARHQRYDTELNKIVRMHQDALEMATELKTLTAPILLMQFLLCVLVWSSMLLYFTVSGFGTQFINLFVLFLFDTTEMFGYCYLGNELSDAASEVGTVLYENGWEAESPVVQKKLQLVLFRSQNRVGIMAGKFAYMNMEQFGEIVRTTYSFFVVLRDVF
ncbi:odorant receptor 30a-like [Anopheles aquasalis]|uniref:odorant receptor 30a-like n=1 Tax=Anopheles aquasalis TaxID=42839 RepID=UPI00215B5C81|nr:odorant receptor 30a-like [Anopheles aquasalis]XP_050082831.1 odorant receptor 30a-like [Anopheles aquasalis]